MTEHDHTTVAAPVIKIITAWLAALGLKSWGDVASLLAAIYTALLIIEWFWKKFWRPIFIARGWVKDSKGGRK